MEYQSTNLENFLISQAEKRGVSLSIEKAGHVNLEIEKIVAEEQINYIDAICHYCEINALEVESVTKLISKPLKERLKWDAIRLNFMKKTSRAKLPL